MTRRLRRGALVEADAHAAGGAEALHLHLAKIEPVQRLSQCGKFGPFRDTQLHRDPAAEIDAVVEAGPKEQHHGGDAQDG